jgi:hypothetical protein
MTPKFMLIVAALMSGETNERGPLDYMIGESLTTSQPVLVCDSFAQLEDIVKLSEVSSEKALEQYEHYKRMVNAHGEPVCIFGNIVTKVTILESRPLGVYVDENGARYTATAQLFSGEESREAWLMHCVPLDESSL